MSKNKSTPSKTSAKDRVSVPQKFTYGIGAFLLSMGSLLVPRMANLVFNMELHVNPALIGLAVTIFRLWDAFTDPLMGNISDNCRLKMGRRRPFIIIGAILCGLIFPLIWMAPRDWGETGLFAWFLISCLVFYTAFTIFSVPYQTLGVEMSPDYSERTRVIAWRAFFSKLAGIGVGWTFALVTLFSDVVSGMRWISLGLGIIFIGIGVLPGIFTEERFLKTASHQKKTGLAESIRLSFESKPFIMVLVMMLLMIMGSAMVNALGDYLNIYYIHGGTDKQSAARIMGWSGTWAMITSIASIPFYIWVSKKFGKTNALLINAIFLLVATLSKWILVTPEHPAWFVVNAALLGPGTTGIWILLPSLMADICDWDELQTGKRREGSYSAIFGWIMKMGYSLTGIITGLILVATGFHAELGAAQAPETLLWLRILYTGIPSLSVLIMIIILLKYPLNAQKSLQIRADLENRRGIV